MTAELIKINKPNGEFWYGIKVDGVWQMVSFGTDLAAATTEYDKIIEQAKTPKPTEEVIKAETI